MSLHHWARHYHGHSYEILGGTAGQIKHRCIYHKLDNNTKQARNGSARSNSEMTSRAEETTANVASQATSKSIAFAPRVRTSNETKSTAYLATARIGIYCPAVDRLLHRPPQPGRKGKYAEAHRWPPRGSHRGEKAGDSNRGVSAFDLAS